MTQSQVTLSDRSEVRRWAEARSARPARRRGATEAEAGLRLVFEDEDPVDDVEPISWDDLFSVMDERGLELVVQDENALGDRSRFATFTHRD